MGMKRLALILVLLSLLLLAAPASAQEPTPEPSPTPTPAYLRDVPLSGELVLHVERSISYGDAAVVIMLLVVWITIILSQAIKIPRGYMR